MRKGLLTAALLIGLSPLCAQTLYNGVLDLRQKDITQRPRFLISDKMRFDNGQLFTDFRYFEPGH